jgi:hypothetical protein
MFQKGVSKQQKRDFGYWQRFAETPIFGFVVRCSVQLSYGRTMLYCLLVFIAFLNTPVKTEFKGCFLGFLETNEKDHQRLGNTVTATSSGKPTGNEYANEERDENRQFNYIPFQYLQT